MRRYGKTIFLTAILAVITVFVITDRGYTGADNTTVETDAKKASAAMKEKSPFSTLSPDDNNKWIALKKEGLCYNKTTAVDIWDYPEKLGFEYDDPVYQLVAFEQEFDEKGNAKYTDIVVPKEIDDIPVVDCKSFAGHYEIKSLRVESMYSSYSNLVLSQSQEAHVASVSGCTSLEYYELPMGIRTLSEGDFKDCKALGFVRIPKDVEWIGSKTFQGCNNLKNITFDKFSNMRNADGLKTLNWWIEHKDKNGGIVYKKCFVNAGDNARKIAVRGQKVNKILENAFQSSRAKKITLENVKKLENYAMAGSQAEEIVLGKGIKIIPTGCFDRNKNLKKIKITSKERIIWGKDMRTSGEFYLEVGLEQNALRKNQKVDIYIYNDKIHQKSLYRANLSAKKVTLHVPAKMVSKYRDCVKCRVVSL